MYQNFTSKEQPKNITLLKKIVKILSNFKESENSQLQFYRGSFTSDMNLKMFSDSSPPPSPHQ